jgi:hypothetical protein
VDKSKGPVSHPASCDHDHFSKAAVSPSDATCHKLMLYMTVSVKQSNVENDQMSVHIQIKAHESSVSEYRPGNFVFVDSTFLVSSKQ